MLADTEMAMNFKDVNIIPFLLLRLLPPPRLLPILSPPPLHRPPPSILPLGRFKADGRSCADRLV